MKYLDVLPSVCSTTHAQPALRLMINKAPRCLLVTSLLALFVGCSHTKSTVDYDKTVDFTELKTFVWTGSPSEAFGSEAKAEFYVEAMEANLESKGLSAVSQEGDFMIRTLPMERYTGQYDTITSGDLEFERSTLRVEFVNSGTGRVIWKGAADAHFSRDGSLEKAEQAIDEAVSKLLKAFPPK